MGKWTIFAATAALVATGTAQAQDTYQWQAPPAASAGQGQRYYLPMGTPLMLRTRTQISSKHNEPGDRVYLEVAESVSFRGQIVIPAGAPVVAEVSRVEESGLFGKEGEVQIRLRYAQTPHGPVRLSGTTFDEGKDQSALSIGAGVLLTPLGFLIQGTSGRLPPATPVQANLAENLDFMWYPQTEVAAASALPARADVFEAAEPGFSIGE